MESEHWAVSQLLLQLSGWRYDRSVRVTLARLPFSERKTDSIDNHEVDCWPGGCSMRNTMSSLKLLTLPMYWVK